MFARSPRYRRHPTKSRMTRRGSQHLRELEHLQVEHKGAVGRDTGLRLAAVCKLGWDCDSSLTTNLHAEHTDVHSLDNLTGANLELESWSLLVCY